MSLKTMIQIQEPPNPLLVDLLKLADKVRDKQRYLELRQRDSNPNYEAGSTPAEAVKAVGDELDLLIARFINDYTYHTAVTYSLNSFKSVGIRS
jgi:hypothetical protein